MSLQWNREQIIALAPDAASAQAAQGLANLRKWSNLGQSATALWGECQGSGATPYQIGIELAEPAFKCSCPSRKFPCKHALALLLLATATPQALPAAPVPAWVQSWLDGRAKRKNDLQSRGTPTGAAPPTAKPVDAKAQAKRAAEREQRVAQGIRDLRLWLNDLMRNGLAELPTRPNSFWQQVAARLIDAQAPGLAAQVQALSKLIVGEQWAERLTAALARLYLLLEAWQRLDTLPSATQADVRALIGWTQSKEELLATPATAGHWCVLSVRNEVTEALVNQRIWLQQVENGRFALLLNFAPLAARQALELHWRVGTQVAAELHFYASATPLRALAAAVTPLGPITQLPSATLLAPALQRYKTELAHNPWLTRFPLLLDQVMVHGDQTGPGKGRWLIYDPARHCLPLSSRCQEQPWQILSLTGGKPCQLFGEWQEEGFLPLGLWHDGQYHGLPPLEENI